VKLGQSSTPADRTITNTLHHIFYLRNSGERNQKQIIKVSFCRTMMQALELQQLVKAIGSWQLAKAAAVGLVI